MQWHEGCDASLGFGQENYNNSGENIVMDRRLTQEDIDWLRKLRQSKATNQLSADIPTSVVRRLTQLACAEVRGGRTAITYRGRDELIERERELN